MVDSSNLPGAAATPKIILGAHGPSTLVLIGLRSYGGEQLPRYSKLYSGAASVVVWLGPSTPDIEFAVSWAQSYAVKKFTAKSIFWLKLSTLGLFSEEAKIKRSLEVFRVHRGILDIFCLPYWDRMWTFQKYVLAKEEPVCICGELEFRVTVL